MKSKVMLVCAFLALLMVFAVNASASTAPNIKIALINQTPYPAQPGGAVTIEVEIQNNGYGAAENMALEINLTEPFKLMPGEQQTKTFGRVGGMDSVKTSYNIRVSSESVSGDYKIKFYSTEMNAAPILNEISVKVQGEPNLVIENATLVPEKLSPGDVAELRLKIKNVGRGEASDVKIKFINTTHLKPLLSMGEIFIGDLVPDAVKEAAIQINIDTSAEEKTYTTELEISYKDESNEQSTDTKSMGIPVIGTINLDIIKKEAIYKRDILRVEVANKGTTEAKSLEARLVINSQTIDINYLSSLKANKKTTFDFPLVLQGSGQLIIDYIGPGLERNRMTEEIILDFEAPSSGNGTTTFIAAVIVLIVAYFLYRIFIRKKK